MVDWKKKLPELEWISDKALREKTELVWEKAFSAGGWEEDELDGAPFTLLVPEPGANLIDHTRTVTHISMCVAEKMKDPGGIDINTDYLIAGALLHDVGKLLENRMKAGKCFVSRSGKFLRHPLSGMGIAMCEGLPEEVCHIIAVHSREGEKSYRSPEAIIVHHADFITFESIKAIKDPPPAE